MGKHRKIAKRGKDPHREQKDEFLHKLWRDHREDKVDQVGMSEMAAAALVAENAMMREGVELTAGEVIDLTGEMARAIGAKTEQAGREMAVKLHNRAIRRKKAGSSFSREMDRVKNMLERKK